MNWEAISAIGEVVGTLVVIVSVLYLARQVKQSTEQSQFASSQAVDTSNMMAFDPIYIPENSLIWTKGHSDPQSLTDHELHIFNMLMTRVLLASFNTTSHYYSRGVYDGDLYLRSAVYFKSLVETPGGKRWYGAHRHLLYPEGQRHLDPISETNEPST
ncbi:MAG: hypothetical protein RIC85_04730 [Gammaproteobacteria bacterium]